LNKSRDISFLLNSSIVSNSSFNASFLKSLNTKTLTDALNTKKLQIVSNSNAINAINASNAANSANAANVPNAPNGTSQNKAFPTGINIDWTGHSGPVKYQGLCGACYAFASVDSVAALNSIYTFGFFIPLSIQQIIDCSNNGLTFGCQGGYL
jgi:hypothetical protein